MISYGNNIKGTDDPLGKVPVRAVFDAIRNPQPHIQSLISQLRVVQQLNPTLYKQLKTRLPYVVCAMFNPQVRRAENFAFTQYFIVDIDHVSSRHIVLADLRHQINSDPRTALCFTSPGGDGLKVMLKLSERCYDAGLYKTFYKAFVMNYSTQYKLQQAVDTRTCDVARACFISLDAEAYYNPEPETIDIKAYVDPDLDPLAAFNVKREVEQAAKDGDKLLKKEHAPEPQSDILQQIRQTLDPRVKAANQKPPAYVPQQLNDAMPSLLQYIEEMHIAINDVASIQYGKKLRCSIALKQAEVNIFYGKRGFSVVQSPRTGTDAEANELLAEVVKSFLVTAGYMV